jgi:hypothetical protein
MDINGRATGTQGFSAGSGLFLAARIAHSLGILGANPRTGRWRQRINGEADRVKMASGPYEAPLLQRGDTVVCEVRSPVG